MQTKPKKTGATFASIAAAIFRRSDTTDSAPYVPPITENSPGVKLRRAEELYKRATSR